MHISLSTRQDRLGPTLHSDQMCSDSPALWGQGGKGGVSTEKICGGGVWSGCVEGFNCREVVGTCLAAFAKGRP